MKLSSHIKQPDHLRTILGLKFHFPNTLWQSNSSAEDITIDIPQLYSNVNIFDKTREHT